MRNPFSGEPFTTSDQDIAAALEDVSVPALLLSCVHMSDDPGLLDGPLATVRWHWTSSLTTATAVALNRSPSTRPPSSG
jgi:hypothetical protein